MKYRTLNLLFMGALATVIITPAYSMEAAQGWCENGGQKVTTGSVQSTTLVQRSYPPCTVTVYVTGTGGIKAAIAADSAGTLLTNPFTSAANGFWQFYASNGHYDVQLSGGGFPLAVSIGDVLLFDPSPGPIVYPSNFSGSDCGVKINSAYAALPSKGGTIQLTDSCVFSTPITFNGPNKIAILQGFGPTTQLTYTGSGTAISFNNGPQFDFVSSIRDIYLTGPGSGSAAVGISIGGSSGAIGFTARNFLIQSFGINATTASNTWLSKWTQGMLRDSPRNLLMPSGQTQAGENVQFEHVVFADAPAPHTNNVWIQGGGQEVIFTDCSFDQAQLRIGNGSTSSAQVVVKGSHFENPNYALSGSVNYDYVTVDNNNGNYLRITDSYMIQDAPSGGPSQFMTLSGGKVSIQLLGMFTPGGSPLTHLANLANHVGIELYGLNDLSGNISGSIFGGTTTGFCINYAGANTNNPTPANFVMKAGDCIGGATLDVGGSIRSTGGQLISTVGTGTAPLNISSQTPVINLNTHPVMYNAAGVQKPNGHITYGTIAANGGGTTSLVLSGSAQFSDASSFTCVASSNTYTAGVIVQYLGGASVHFVGPTTSFITYTCTGI